MNLIIDGKSQILSRCSACVCTGIQSEDKNKFLYIQSEDILTKRGQNFSPRFVTRCTVLTLFIHGHRDVILSLYVPGMFRHVWKKCPHFECVIHRFVLVLNAGTDTIYTRVYSVSSLWMPEQVGVSPTVSNSVATLRIGEFSSESNILNSSFYMTHNFAHIDPFSKHALDKKT